MTDPVPNVHRTFHRLVLAHNSDEYEQVAASMEIWGYEAKVLGGGICVQAFPGIGRRKGAYSFCTTAAPREMYSFINGRMVVREVAWDLGMPEVEERDGGKAACIRLSWLGQRVSA